MPFLDYGKVREQISLEQVLTLIGYTLLVKTKWRSYGRCPLHCCVASRAASFYLSKNLWYCHRCKRGGNQLDLYVIKSGMDVFPAALDLCNRMRVKPPTCEKLPPLTEKGITEYRKGKS